MRLPSLLAIALILGSCSTEQAPEAPTSELPPSESSEYPIAVPDDATEPTVTARGIGPVAIGMTVAEASEATGVDLPVEVSPVTSECGYIRLPEVPDVSLMVVSGSIARIDIGPASDLRTAEGAGVGDSEAQIYSLYPDQVEAEPHEFTLGRYLTVPDPVDPAFRLMFETDQQGVVQQYRAGILPPVGWIEGCV